MGLGGDLLWNGAFRALHAHDGHKIAVGHVPGLTDLLAGSLYDRSITLAESPAFRGNPRLAFPAVSKKHPLSRWIDRAFLGALARLGLRPLYERAIFRMSQRRLRRGGLRLVHVDMRILSYAERENKDRMIWKKGGHAIQVMLQSFGITTQDIATELHLSSKEESQVDDILKIAGVSGAFVVIEPGTNKEWFGDLRSWPIERWMDFANKLRAARPDIPLVQIGLPGTPLVPQAIDLRGKTTFRQAAGVIKRSSLFIGTEGGLMHAARGVDANALILWGGVTLPEFAGYIDRHRIICHRVPCAPCGQKGWCHNDHICMRSITIEETLTATLASLPASLEPR